MRLINAMSAVPAVVMGPRTEVLAWNPLGHALLAGHCAADAPDHPADRPNLTRMLFLDAHTRELYARWDEEAARAVASFRLVAGRHRDDRELADLVGELSVNSDAFAALWAKHPVHDCRSGRKAFRHPEVGELELEFEVLHLPQDTGHRILTYTAIPGTSCDAALRLLTRHAAECTGPANGAARAGGAGGAGGAAGLPDGEQAGGVRRPEEVLDPLAGPAE